MVKIMFLGAAHFQLAPIIYAKSQNYFVITCDNNLNNPGHYIADKSYNISTLEKEQILNVAIKEKINGVLSYGSDISAKTVSFVRKVFSVHMY